MTVKPRALTLAIMVQAKTDDDLPIRLSDCSVHDWESSYQLEVSHIHFTLDREGWVVARMGVLLYGLSLEGLAEIHYHPEGPEDPPVWRHVRVTTPDNPSIGHEIKVEDVVRGAALTVMGLEFVQDGKNDRLRIDVLRPDVSPVAVALEESST